MKVKVKYYSKAQFLRKTGIKLHRLDYLFRTFKLNREDFMVIGGKVAYTDSDVKRVLKVINR